MIALMLAASLAATAAFRPGARYVAVASSFAAGPGVGGPAAQEGGADARARKLSVPRCLAAVAEPR